MRNGKLRHKMTLQEPVTTQDTTTGEMVIVWTDVAKVWASLEPLSANAFVAAGAEQSEVSARVTIRYREGVTSKMRLVYRGMYYDIKGVLADPKSGLEYLTLPVGEGVRYENPAPPVCTVTLTNDGLDALGLEPMAVSGQTVSVTGDGSSNYGMWTGAAGVPVDWAGTRIVEMSRPTLPLSASSGLFAFGICKASDQRGVFAIWSYPLGKWVVTLQDIAGVSPTTTLILDGSVSDIFSIGVDGSTGDTFVYKTGGLVVTKDTPASYGTFAGLAGMFSGESAITIDQARSLALGDTYSAEIITQADKYTASYPAGTLDWCGNPI